MKGRPLRGGDPAAGCGSARTAPGLDEGPPAQGRRRLAGDRRLIQGRASMKGRLLRGGDGINADFGGTYTMPR